MIFVQPDWKIAKRALTFLEREDVAATPLKGKRLKRWKIMLRGRTADGRMFVTTQVVTEEFLKGPSSPKYLLDQRDRIADRPHLIREPK